MLFDLLAVIITNLKAIFGLMYCIGGGPEQTTPPLNVVIYRQKAGDGEVRGQKVRSLFRTLLQIQIRSDPEHFQNLDQKSTTGYEISICSITKLCFCRVRRGSEKAAKSGTKSIDMPLSRKRRTSESRLVRQIIIAK